MGDHHGRFVWYELMADDAGAARAFYAAVVGWTAEDAGMPGMDYTILKAGDRMVAGLWGLTDEASAAGARPGWLGYVGADDIDATAERVRGAGGAVHKAPEDIPGVGRFAVVGDPGGAIFCLFKSDGERPPPAPPMTTGHAGWHELMSGPVDEIFPFYAGLFGWAKTEAMDMGPMGTYQLFAPAEGEQAIGGMMKRPEQMPAPAWLYYFVVDGIEAAAERVKSAGGQVINGPMEVPGGAWILHGLDDQGVMFALVAPPA